MKNDLPEKRANWTQAAVFVTLAILLSSFWAQCARARGMLADPQNAGVAVAVTQASVLVSALATMALLARSSFRRVGWRVGPWTAYAAVALVLVGLVALMALALAFGYQRLSGGTVIPSDTQPMAIPFLLVFAFVVAFAHEFGWRGFLLPQLLPLGIRSALLVSGVLWFLWKVPLIYLGLLDSASIQASPAQTWICHFLGTCGMAVIFGYLRWRFDSVFLPTFAYGLLNVLSGVSFVFFTEANPLLSDFGSPVGTALTLAVAGVVWRLVGRNLKKGLLPGQAVTSAS